MNYNISFLKEDQQQLAESLLKESKLMDRQAEISEYFNATVLPFRNPDYTFLGGVVSSSGEFLQQSGLYEERKFGIYDYSEEDVIYDESTVLYIGYLLSIYGHLITDDIKKCWALLINKIHYDKIIYVAEWQEDSPPKHVQELFSILGIDLSKCHCVTRVTRFKKILLPDNSFIHHDGKKYYTKEYSETIQYIKSQVSNSIALSNFANKIYFSRTALKQTWHRDIGEEQLEAVFKKDGYSIVHPERHSIKDQINMLCHCEYFAATEGSVAHNAIWCRPGTKVTLLRKANCINTWQLVINESACLDVSYVDAHNSVRTNSQFPMNGPFFMCITPELERYFDTRLLHIPLWMRPSWYVYRYQLQETRLYKKINRIVCKLCHIS